MPFPSQNEVLQLVKTALAEDVGTGDATTLSTVPPETLSTAVMVAREPMTLAGVALAETVFKLVSTDVRLERKARDGSRLERGDVILRISGPAQALLTAERVALNLVQRLSGVATLTSRYVTAVQGTGAKILDTRKTTPGLRHFEKYAVTCGGGTNHRTGLYDLILIKDNHLAALKEEKPNAIDAAVRRAREKYPQLRVEVEADSLEQVRQAVDAGADIILLDNMPPAVLRDAVAIVNGRAMTEASGGITLETIRAVAETGVNAISVGAITHSARAVDIALDFES